MDQQIKILFSYAHPDDETFGSGGTIARYADSGAEVSLICATGGELGTVAPEFLEGYDSVAERRLVELTCAADLLGLTEVVMLGYRDSGMMGSDENQHPDCLWSAELDAVAQQVFDEIQRIRPQVVVTFDAFGGYGHPDHIKIHQATTRAFELSVAQGPFRPQALFYSTFDRRPLVFAASIMRLIGLDPTKIGRNKDLNLYDVADVSSTVHMRVKTGKYRQIVWEAAQCHASQLDRANAFFMRLASKLFFGTREAFEQVYPQVSTQRFNNDLLSHVKFS